MFCKQFLAYTVHIDWYYNVIHKHSCRSQHISGLTTCTYMFRQVCTMGPSFFNTKSGMHRRLFEGRHLVFFIVQPHLKSLFEINSQNLAIWDVATASIFSVWMFCYYFWNLSTFCLLTWAARLDFFLVPLSVLSLFLSFFLFLRHCSINARIPDRSRAFVHGHTFLHSWSGPMTLIAGLLHGATFLSILVFFVSFIWP